MKRSWLVCLALAAGCGGGSSAPTFPSVPSVNSITVTGSDVVLVGSSVTFTAAGQRWCPYGTTVGTDAPTVATVESYTGRVTRWAPGPRRSSWT